MDIKQEKDIIRKQLSVSEMNEFETHMRHLKNFFLFCKDHQNLVLGSGPLLGTGDDALGQIIDDFLAA